MATARSHLAPFREGPRPWLAIARNSIPAIGVFWFGWSAPLAIFQVWFDGVAALAAMFALQIGAFRRLDPEFRKIPAPVAWALALLILGIPYWFMLALFAAFLLPANFWAVELQDPAVLGALLFVLVSHFLEHTRHGYNTMTEAQIRKEADWHITVHVARAAVILMVTFLFTFKILIAALAFALSYLEIYPMRTLKALGADASLEDGNQSRSRD
jgi:hypothetical protein